MCVIQNGLRLFQTILLVVCFLLSCYSTYASDSKLDSLRTIVKDSLASGGVVVCREINLEILKRLTVNDKVAALEVGEEATSCALEIDNQDQIFETHFEVAEIYFSRWGMTEQAIELHHHTLKYATVYTDSSQTLNRIAIMHGENGKLDKALDYFLRAADLNEKHKNVMNISIAYANVAKVYEYAGELDKSLKYLNKILELDAEELDDLDRANYLSMIGLMYFKQDQFDQAKESTENALSLLPKNEIDLTNRKEVESAMYVYLLLADIYTKEKNYRAALDFAYKAKEIGIGLENKEHFKDAKLKILDIHLKSGNYHDAKEVGEELVSIIEKFGTKVRLSNVHSSLSNANRELGNFEKALYHYQRFDSITNQINSEKVKVNLMAAEQKAIEQRNENLKISEKYYKDLSNRKSFTIGLLLIGSFVLAALFAFLTRSLKTNKNLTNELQIKNEKLNNYIQSNIKLEQFAHLASHDMKSPLVTISSYTNLLQTNSERLDDNSKKYLSFIELGANRLTNLIGDLLSYAKINSQVLNYEEFHLVELIEEIEEDIEFEIGSSNGQIRKDLKADIIIGDRQKLKQAFMNLIVNSLKFKKANNNVIIDITSSETEKSNVISFRDNGLGISQSFQKDLFTPYKRYYAQDEFDGTGLGLTMVKEIVEKHLGSITYESEEGVGTCFTISLPKKSNTSHSEKQIAHLN